ncbi:hypothetical protein [Streptosporangium sp. NPDC087985]|uniref:hypothetical protein n=1 Tax=Streptosporangium sp. NPDC087985 TaxID=3366196 RepID=UPI003818A888
MNFCLSDLVPPLRWSDAATIPLLRDRPDLPDAWWRSLPMARLLTVLDPEELAEILTRIAMEHWPAAAVGDVLPALYVLDPDEADEPCTAIALDRTGSWAGLLSLTGHDLRDQPFIQPFPLLSVLFAAVFHRVAHLAPGSGSPAMTPAGASGSQVPAAAAEAGPEAVAEGGAGYAAPAPAPETGSEPVPEPETGSRPGRDAGAFSVPAARGDRRVAVPAAEEAEPATDGEEARQPTSLHTLVDGAFVNLEDKSWAVAQNRLFSDEPATVEALAKLFAVTPEMIKDVEGDLRRRFKAWLISEAAAPYREHLAGLKKILGKAAPKSRLIAAADWHALELHSLDIPAWQFVLASLPEYHLVDEWLVEGDITELRHHTRDVISSAKPPLTMTKALALVTSLGIHPEVSKEWLENVPQLRILATGQRANSSAPTPKPRSAERPVAGAPGREPEGEPGKTPYQPLKDVSLTRRCFRQPDGRWWLRIDITPEHIQGSECPLPSGFAAYLGMSPGDSRTVNSAVGELTLSWQNRPVVESLRMLLSDVGAKPGSHLFLTLSDEGVLRARHLPAADAGIEPTVQALRLVGYTAPGGTPEQAGRVIATRVGMSGPVSLPDLLVRLRERGDRDLLSLLA